MALKAEIEGIVKKLTAHPLFLYGTAAELNTLADSLPIGSPYVFMLSLQPVKAAFTNNNSISNKYSIYMEFLFKVSFDTYTADCEPYDNQAIAMANEFLIRLKNLTTTDNKKVFLVDVNDSASYQPIFNKYDVNTYGRNLTMDLKTVYNDKICL